METANFATKMNDGKIITHAELMANAKVYRVNRSYVLFILLSPNKINSENWAIAATDSNARLWHGNSLKINLPMLINCKKNSDLLYEYSYQNIPPSAMDAIVKCLKENDLRF